MRHILVTNSKGGCGKSTIATNLAAYFASEGYSTALADYDIQATSLSWLDVRPEDHPSITGLAAFEDGLRYLPRNTDYLIIDAPAGSSGPELTALVNHAETIIVPILPSPIDIKAGAEFVDELMNKGKIANRKARVAIIANRIKENTLIFQELDEYLDKLKVPYTAALREAQNYIRAYQRGLGIHELPYYQTWQDWEQWEELIKWLNSRRSQPR